MTNLKQRTVTGAVFGAVMIGAILFSPVSFFILFFIITLLSVLEFYRLIRTDEIKPQVITGTIISLLIFLYVSYSGQQFLTPDFATSLDIAFKTPFAIILLLLLIFIFELFRNTQKPFLNIAVTITGVIYISLPISLFTIIAYDSAGELNYHPYIILGYFILLWTSDTFAYLVGSKCGKHKLFERISPKKTWEGCIGGGIAALLAAFIISKYYTELPFIDWMIIAVIIVVTGTFGDLTESMLKRSLNIKDSGSIMPGHGGILDRFDGLLGSAPFVFCYLYFIDRM